MTLRHARSFVTAHFAGLFTALIDFFFPPRCLMCGVWLGSYSQGYFCLVCTDHFTHTGSPLCLRCGMMFPSREGGDHLCGTCLASESFFDAARALARYEGGVRTTIHRFKYRRQTILAKPLGMVMAEHGRRLLPVRGYDLIVPVPLHRDRLRERGYNQSAMLARHIGRCWNVRVDCTGLQRVRPTPPQVTLARKERAMNVRGAFSWAGKPIKGQQVLLVDDVMTSGSTMNECARVLKRAGAALVDALALARTPQESYR